MENNAKISQIVFQKVSKIYKNDEIALKDIDLVINEGEVVYITGPSGSGKTTLLKLIYKDEDVSDGLLFVFGKNIKKYNKRKLRRKLGFVFQNYELISNKTVYENVAYPLQILGENPFKIKKKTIKILEEVGLEKHAKKKPTELSGGEQQRVSIARAMVTNPKIIICDEPTGNLDDENSEKIIELLSRLNKKGITIIITTHNNNLIEKYAERVIFLEDGKLVDDITVTPAKEAENLEEQLVNYFQSKENDEEYSEEKHGFNEFKNNFLNERDLSFGGERD